MAAGGVVGIVVDRADERKALLAGEQIQPPGIAEHLRRDAAGVHFRQALRAKIVDERDMVGDVVAHGVRVGRQLRVGLKVDLFQSGSLLL